MNLKKLSVAAALSIGIMTLGGIARADQVGAAAPVCPPPRVQMPCPAPCPVEPCPCPTGAAVPILLPQAGLPQEVYSPLLSQPQCPGGAAPVCEPITGVIPNCAPNAKIIKRQAYAFPDIGSSSVVIPKGSQMVQIGGDEEAVAVNSTNCAGISAVPQAGALTLMPTRQAGGACGPVCPVQVAQGLEILRCSIPGTTRVLQSAYCDPCMTGAAMPMYPTGAACPVNPCDPCNPCAPLCPTGAAVPLYPYDPCNPCSPMGAAAPIYPFPTGAACPVNPCDPCNPCQPMANPCNPCAPAVPMAMNPCNPCDPCATGIGSQLSGCPRTIQTSSGLQIQRTALVPVIIPQSTGAACPVGPQFPDVSNQMISGCDINKLAAQGVLAGYPDRTYKPNLAILRDEFASAIVAGAALEGTPDFQQQIFNDVPLSHWANADIDKAYNSGVMEGYPNCMFRPKDPVTRAEALSSIAKAIPGEISACEAQQILSCYPDSNQIPAWAASHVAESLKAGILCDLPDGNCIRPNDIASRSEVASMVDELREVLALAPCPQPTGAAAQLQPQVVTTTIPTLKMQFEDIVSARTSEVGDRIVAKTTEPVNMDGVFYPAGTVVRGKVSEVVRPGIGQSGAIRVEFTSMGNDGCKTTLPREILSATVVQEDNPNIIGRFLAWPFSWPGKVAGVAGRTAGGAAIIAGNTVENFLCNIGNGTNELFNGEIPAAGRSYLMALTDPFVGVFDTARTALSGTVGILKVSGDEIAYVVKPDGSRVAQINPDEILSVAFASQQ